MKGAPDGLVLTRRAFVWVENALCCLIVLAIMGVAVWRIVVREAEWQVNAMWADPFLKHAVLWLTLIGAALATKDRNHINIDVVGRLLKGRWRSACQVLTSLFSTVICALLAYACCRFVLDQRTAFIDQTYDSSGTIFGNVPAWHAQAVMPVAFAIMSLRFLLQTVEDAYAVVMGVPPEQQAADDEGERA